MRIHLPSCDSTQDEARRRVAEVDPGTVVVVTAGRQLRGRGREGRTWVEPPGDAMFASIGARGPLPVHVLEELPHDVARIVIDAAWRAASAELAWKAPNDVVSAADGAKVAGVLVDARTVGDTVTELVVGIGVNVHGPAFVTDDGRGATTLAALGGPVDLDLLRDEVCAAVAARISERR